MYASPPASGPFSLHDEPAYRRWRDAKLAKVRSEKSALR